MDSKSDKGRRAKAKEELRVKRIHFRVTYDEYIKLIKKKPSHLNDSEFFRQSLLTQNVTFNDYTQLDASITEMRKIGVNVNQIAKKVNSFGALDANDQYILSSKIKELNNLYYQMLDIINNK